MAFNIHQVFLAGAIILATMSTSQLLAQTETKMCVKRGNQRGWVSRVISEHMWDFRVISDTNPTCTMHYEVYRQHLDNFATWSIQMLDASELVPSGILAGDTHKLGNFEECLKTRVPPELGFSAQYCLPVFNYIPSNFSTGAFASQDEWAKPVWSRIMINNRTKAPRDRFSLAFCIPSSCSHVDLQASLQSFFNDPMRQKAYDFKVDVHSLQCTTSDSPTQSTGGLIFKYLMIAMILLVLFCTLADLLLATFQKKNGSSKISSDNVTGARRWISPFSILRNLPQLFATTSSPDDYKMLHGIKAVLMLFVVIAHISSIRMLGRAAIVNWDYVEDLLARPNPLFSAAPLLPDFFYCISGFLMCLSTMKRLNAGKFNFWTHIINKLFRVFPPYFFFLAATIFILPSLGTGPFWKSFIEPEVEFCRKNWLLNIMFVNNYVLPGEWCFPHTYFLAADMHFFMVGTIIVYLCWRWNSYKGAVLGLATFLSFFMPFLAVYLNDYDGVLNFDYKSMTTIRRHQYFMMVYMKSHTRCGGYMIGIIGGFSLLTLQKRGYCFSKIISWAGISMAIFILFSVAAIKWCLTLSAYDVIVRALYAGLNSQLIGIALMIVTVIQITNGFGNLDSLMLTFQNICSALSRLSYWLYLLNVPIIYSIVAAMKTPIHMTYEGTVFGGQHLGDLFPVYITAMICYLVVEAPINHGRPIILKYILSTDSRIMRKIQ
ncbi:unnamed protein product [Bemisia tabaci]|uniref:Nose resistant-to-fluoxetine protein N-terminal domain-containing protein n=1 Tax=Bemisia tabaci TaxID=7038 RepID=A0A9P0F0U2_BEMTA|nr:unnamed protein product [Bemisia tabaci]